MDNYFEDRSFTFIFFPAVLFAAFAGGRGPAILTTLLCLLISAKFLGRSLVTEPGNLIDIGCFTILGPILGFMGDRLLRESDQARNRQ
ncbi:DUF4118 domain-containing protein, partial [Klebsiella pneumoniae]|uniref:DUF4118 domain-containing protein n=1 Tax=Klebsiella pneumoniae TaxID=573 RepID=UPI0035CD1FC3